MESGESLHIDGCIAYDDDIILLSASVVHLNMILSVP